jgi:hypothetical protein
VNFKKKLGMTAFVIARAEMSLKIMPGKSLF